MTRFIMAVILTMAVGCTNPAEPVAHDTQVEQRIGDLPPCVPHIVTDLYGRPIPFGGLSDRCQTQPRPLAWP